MEHNLILDESDRQMALMALAHLAVERPGWDDALNRIVRQIDNVPGEGWEVRAELYDKFRELHGQAK
jgi:hypothetical protein